MTDTTTDQRVCRDCGQPIWPTGQGFTDYTHADIVRDADHQAVVQLAHPMDADPFAGLDDPEN